MALLAGVVCAALLPELVLIAGGLLFGSPFKFLDLRIGMVWLLIVLLLSFASFWCACAVNGTVRAALWVFPVLATLVIAGQFGGWTAEKLVPLVVSKLDFFSQIRFINNLFSKVPFDTFLLREISVGDFASLASRVQTMELISSQGGTLKSLYLAAALFLVPIPIFAMVQSYRQFQTQAQDSLISLTRNLLPLATMAFLFSFSFIAPGVLTFQAQHQMWTVFYETHGAIEKIIPGTLNLAVTHPLQLTIEDLAKVAPLSERTRRWLRNSRITVAPQEYDTCRYCDGISGFLQIPPGKTYSGYRATIHLAGGSECTLSCVLALHHINVYLRGVCE